MLLTVDIGNTNTVFGLFEAKNLVAHFRIETRKARTSDEYAAFLRPLFAHAGLPVQIDAGIIATVVPPALFSVKRFFQQHLKVEPFVVSAAANLGMPILYQPPTDVGADRIVNAKAAYAEWQQGCIIVDFGTATTFDAVTPKGEYLGGTIATGIVTSADALYQAAARLPRVEFVKPERVVGQTTVASIQSGLFFGYVCLTDGIVNRMKAELGYPCKVIATGGLAPLIARASETIETVDEMLTLKGLELIHSQVGHTSTPH